MARGAQKQAQQGFDQSKKTFANTQDVYGGAKSTSNDLYKQLFPMLEREATNPEGYAPQDLAAQRTAAEQSIGGATAGAVGEGGLAAARTRNAGGFQSAGDEAVRSGERELSQRAVETEANNANLKESKRQAGLGGLASLYGTNMQTMLSSLGLGNQSTEAGVGATNALTQAGQSGWFQNMLGAINALKPSGSFGGGSKSSFSMG